MCIYGRSMLVIGLFSMPLSAAVAQPAPPDRPGVPKMDKPAKALPVRLRPPPDRPVDLNCPVRVGKNRIALLDRVEGKLVKGGELRLIGRCLGAGPWLIIGSWYNPDTGQPVFFHTWPEFADFIENSTSATTSQISLKINDDLSRFSTVESPAVLRIIASSTSAYPYAIELTVDQVKPLVEP